MSSASEESESDESPSLYDPPVEEGEEIDLTSEEEEELHLELPRDLAGQLMKVASHLGLSPSIVASRAIDMVCDEIGIVEEQELTTGTLIQKYQTRIDLLHTLDFDPGDDPDGDGEGAPGWDAVDDIIAAGEEAKKSGGDE